MKAQKQKLAKATKKTKQAGNAVAQKGIVMSLGSQSVGLEHEMADKEVRLGLVRRTAITKGLDIEDSDVGEEAVVKAPKDSKGKKKSQEESSKEGNERNELDFELSLEKRMDEDVNKQVEGSSKSRDEGLKEAVDSGKKPLKMGRPKSEKSKEKDAEL
ncbi:hypothetical protein CPB83DRAFT_840954 [Crepidotus variabilis]|uniref:Uncharacterized protein n=1 Tax=Crepidotus variabilis TaxID=179855 RepID=A0A9P6E3H6_9AGAR|nr:hypothetical protein CPB83DRAFT_840954 [Crepidotus variabilis]